MMRNGLYAASVLALATSGSLAAQGFGTAVAVGDEAVFVAEPTNEFKPGVVYVYGRRGGEWVEIVQLMASDATAGDRFGRSLSYSEGRLLAGATTRDNSTGTAYIFENSGGTWRQVARLSGSGAQEGEAYGRVVALAGDVAVVGAWGANGARGGAYVFRRQASGNWTEEGFLTVDSLDAQMGVSMTVATDGARVLLGFPRIQRQRGAVHVFRHQEGMWSHEAELSLDNAAMNTALGTTVMIDGDHILTGAPGHDRGNGAMIGFEYDAERNAWSDGSPALTPFDGSARSGFGSAAAAAGDEILIGAPTARGRMGQFYAVRWEDGTWVSATKAFGTGVESGDGFGAELAAMGDIAVAASLGDDYGAGSAYIMERENGRWTVATRIVGAEETIAPMTGGQVDCSDGEASGFDCSQVDLLSFLPISALGGSRGVQLNDIWGWTDPQTNREFALVGRIEGTAFVDVTDPLNPTFVGDLPMTDGARAASWRDIKVYNNHAFIVADGAGDHGMQVFDLTQLRDVREPTTFAATALYDGVASVHNIVINEGTGFAYAVGSNGGGETCGGGLHMVNIQNPTRPTFAGCFADETTGRRKTGYSHDAQCVVYSGPDSEHAGREICFGSNETALSIADVTDKSNTVALAMASYPNVGYTHQGWLTEDHRYFYMNDELDEIGGQVSNTRTLVWDVSDLDDPVLVKEHMAENRSSDHNLYILGNLMYQSNYVSGLRVLDISDRVNPVQIGFFDTVPYGEDLPGFNGSWSNYPYFKSGIVVVTSVREGLFIVKKRQRDIIP